MKANLLPSGDHAPAEPMKLSASNSVDVLTSASFFTDSPVAASARYKSNPNSPRAAKNATHLPSGLITGERFVSPSRFTGISGRPDSLGFVRFAITGVYAARVAAIHSFDSESEEMPSVRLMPWSN